MGIFKKKDPFDISEENKPKVIALTEAVMEIGEAANADDFTDFFVEHVRGHSTSLTQQSSGMLGRLAGYDLLKATNKPVEGQAQMAIVAYFMDRYAKEYAKAKEPK